MKLKQLQKHITHSTLITDEAMIDVLINQRFHVGERFLGLLIDTHEATLFLNRLFPFESNDINIVRFDDTDDVIRLLAAYIKGSVLAVDKNLKSGFLLPLMSHCPQVLIQLDTQADYIRSIKTAEEIDLMRQASSLNDRIMAEVRDYLSIGLSEIEVAQFIASRHLHYGVDASFPTIVAFGDHAADPHATPSHRILKEGESIIIDMGCILNGYCSDMTRTFYVNAVEPEDIYTLVLEANLAAIQTIKPGVLFKDIDAAARSVIERHGYGAQFIHRTGHGIGREVHEPYDVSASNERVVEVGMTFSIEPGIYLPNQSAVRIEDLVVVSENGCEVLNHFPKNQPLIHK
jgi:Xaa-Pro dipeptidase